MLVLGSLISTIGGFGIESIKQQIFYLLPLLILMPALNDMTGDYGTIVAARFTTLLYTGKIKARWWWRSRELRRMFGEIAIISTLSAIYVAVLASIIARFRDFPMSWDLFQQILFLALITTWLLVAVLFTVCIFGGFFVYKKKHDPDNYLIPLATSLADLGSMLILTVLVRTLF
jgi:cation transporter-like permease